MDMQRIDNLEKMEELANFDRKRDAEGVGYAMASNMCLARSYSPELLLLVTLASKMNMDDPDAIDQEMFLSEAYASLGIIKWCLDQRKKLH